MTDNVADDRLEQSVDPLEAIQAVLLPVSGWISPRQNGNHGDPSFLYA